MNWNGINCDVCQKPFKEGDDVVVCPDCGTPMHRSCYRELGHCPHEDRHAEGFVWSAPSREPSVPLKDQQKTPDGKEIPDGYVMCSRCGTVNPKTNEYCELCRYPLKKTGTKIPGADREVTDENGSNTTFAEYMKDQVNVNPEEQVSDELTAREVAAYVGPNSLNFLYKFRNMLQNRTSVSFNLPAFLFNGFYCFYRKMYKVGAVVLLISLLSYVPFLVYYIPYFKEMLAGGASTLAELTTIAMGAETAKQLLLTSKIANYVGLVLNVLCGLFVNKFYLKQVQAAVKAERIHSHASIGSPQYYGELTRRGGTSGLSVLLLIVGLIFISSIISSVFILG